MEAWTVARVLGLAFELISARFLFKSVHSQLCARLFFIITSQQCEILLQELTSTPVEDFT